MGKWLNTLQLSHTVSVIYLIYCSLLNSHWINYTDCPLSQELQDKICIEMLLNTWKILAEILKETPYTSKRQLCHNGEHNQFCEHRPFS
jgi:hypothetical protein